MIRSGLYNESDLLGAKVKIISSPSYMLFEEANNSRIYTIEKIEYRILTDGKLKVVICLNGLNDRFLPENLEILELRNCE